MRTCDVLHSLVARGCDCCFKCRTPLFELESCTDVPGLCCCLRQVQHSCMVRRSHYECRVNFRCLQQPRRNEHPQKWRQTPPLPRPSSFIFRRTFICPEQRYDSLNHNNNNPTVQWLLPVEDARRDDFSRRCAFSSLARSALSLAYLKHAGK